MNIDQFRERIKAVGLQPFEDRIVSLSRPCVRLARCRVQQAELAPLDSRLGGDPHLPVGFEWPFWSGVPLGHIATVRLSAASKYDASGLLPRQGLLYFWYDLSEQPWGYRESHAGSALVTYVADEDTPLTLQAMPMVRADEYADLDRIRETDRHPCKVEFEQGWTIPNGEWLRAYQAQDKKLVENEEFWTLHCDLTKPRKHYLLGHPQPEQGPMENQVRCVTKDLEPWRNSPENSLKKDLEWQLLFQVGTDEDGPGWMWGDAGKLYYWIPRAALRAADFSKVWLILQCG
ncbi:MAG TPA: YwqG family protein [Phycisphaerales bacterium]|nr:YwqG family protein [Phycisphaerales bacterium]